MPISKQFDDLREITLDNVVERAYERASASGKSLIRIVTYDTISVQIAFTQANRTFESLSLSSSKIWGKNC